LTDREKLEAFFEGTEIVVTHSSNYSILLTRDDRRLDIGPEMVGYDDMTVSVADEEDLVAHEERRRVQMAQNQAHHDARIAKHKAEKAKLKHTLEITELEMVQGGGIEAVRRLAEHRAAQG